MVITAHYFLGAFDCRKEKIIIKKIKDFDIYFEHDVIVNFKINY